MVETTEFTVIRVTMSIGPYTDEPYHSLRIVVSANNSTLSTEALIPNSYTRPVIERMIRHTAEVLIRELKDTESQHDEMALAEIMSKTKTKE